MQALKLWILKEKRLQINVGVRAPIDFLAAVAKSSLLPYGSQKVVILKMPQDSQFRPLKICAYGFSIQRDYLVTCSVTRRFLILIIAMSCSISVRGLG